MPIYSATVAAPGDFDGLTAATGLFDAAVSTGGTNIQVRINSVVYSTGAPLTDWTLAVVDPSDSQSITLLTDTTADFVLGGPGGFMLLPTNSDKAPWHLTFVTNGQAADGTIKIDYDFAVNES